MYKFEQLDKEKRAWLAGLFQGEATFSLDRRVRSKSQDPDYQPPPPIPGVKIDMVEQDLMEHVGECLDQPVNKLKRRTSTGKPVYRVAMAGRDKTEAFLRAILPYVVGTLKRQKIQDLLDVCDQYNQWLASGGRSKAAACASAKAKAQKKSN